VGSVRPPSGSVRAPPAGGGPARSARNGDLGHRRRPRRYPSRVPAARAGSPAGETPAAAAPTSRPPARPRRIGPPGTRASATVTTGLHSWPRRSSA